MNTNTRYSRHQHAAHYDGHPDKGHDLEQWDVAEADVESDCFPPVPSPNDVPFNATYSHGYLDAAGLQRWVFSRTAPLTGESCQRCNLVAR